HPQRHRADRRAGARLQHLRRPDHPGHAHPARSAAEERRKELTMEVLRLQNLQKSFGSVRALKNASLSLREGEVVALLGDNGAGKSTLIKAISGVHPIDGGAIYVRGDKVSIRTARDAMNLGIETIHQDT